MNKLTILSDADSNTRLFFAGGMGGRGLCLSLASRVSSRFLLLLFFKNSSKRLNFKGIPFWTWWSFDNFNFVQKQLLDYS